MEDDEEKEEKEEEEEEKEEEEDSNEDDEDDDDGADKDVADADTDKEEEREQAAKKITKYVKGEKRNYYYQTTVKTMEELGEFRFKVMEKEKEQDYIGLSYN
jgi:hypothetical protein